MRHFRLLALAERWVYLLPALLILLSIAQPTRALGQSPTESAAERIGALESSRLADGFARVGTVGQPIPLTAIDQAGRPLSDVTWEAITPGGTVDPAGLFRAGAPGLYQVLASQPAVTVGSQTRVATEKVITFTIVDPKVEPQPAPVAVWQEGESWVIALGLFQQGQPVAPISKVEGSLSLPPEPLHLSAPKGVRLAGGLDSVSVLPTGSRYLVRYTIDPAEGSPTLTVARQGQPAVLLTVSQLRPSERGAPPQGAQLGEARFGTEDFSIVGSSKRISGNVQVRVTDPEGRGIVGVDVVVEAEPEGITLGGHQLGVYRTDDQGQFFVHYETVPRFPGGRLFLRSAYLGSEPIALPDPIMRTGRSDG